MAKRNAKSLDEQVLEIEVEYPGIVAVVINDVGDLPKTGGYFKWYYNMTIKDTIIEHRKKTGWIPARIFVDKTGGSDGDGHFVMCQEKQLMPEIITKKVV